MSDLNPSQCMACGSRLPAGLPAGFCPACALSESPASEPAAGPLPAAFGDYELLTEIARGGMGLVYKARQKSLNRIVAVKFLLAGRHADPAFIKRFHIEASAAAALQHPNIVAIHEVGVQGDDHFLVMDYVDGPNLATLVKEQPMSPKRAAGYVRSIAEAIDYAHGKGILHRDLKPANVLVDKKDQPRVTDFGLAKRLVDSPPSTLDGSPLTLSGQIVGSPGYMPPEQARGERGTMGPRSDVYSLGATLYHLLTGRPPFGSGSISETLRQVESQEPVPVRLLNPGVPQDLETICLRCLEKNPQHRFGTAMELAGELARFLRDEPIQSRPISRAAKTRRWCRRNPTGAGLIAALAVALLASVAFLISLKRQNDIETTLTGIIVKRLEEQLNQDWERDDRSFQRIKAEVLAAVVGQRKPAPGPNALPLSFGATATDSPITQARKYAPVLALFEEKLASRLGRPVVMDLLLFKSRGAREGLVANNVDLVRLGALTFVHAHSVQPGLQPLVELNTNKQGIIFARAGLGISNIAQLVGHSFAFGDTNATLSFWAKYHLLRANIHGTNLSRYAILDSQAHPADRVAAKGAQRQKPADRTSHSEVIRAVLAGEFDGGVARVGNKNGDVRGELGKRLVPLLYFDSEPNLWVASAAVPSTVVNALKATFLSLTQEELNLMVNAEQGFREVNRARLEELRQLERQVEESFPNFGPAPGTHAPR